MNNETKIYEAEFLKSHPRNVGGICEWCGVLDWSKPSEVQYTLCPHFKKEHEQES